MLSLPRPCPLLPDDAMASDAAVALLDRARALQRAARSGRPRPLLEGRNVGLLCDDEDDPDAALLHRAARALGAQVARIRPHLSEPGTPDDVQRTARLLGRLYDLLVCQGIAPPMVQRLRRDAGVPVYGGIAASPTALDRLVEHLDGDAPADDRRCYLMQAALAKAIA